jgi:hypothetical protein
MNPTMSALLALGREDGRIFDIQWWGVVRKEKTLTEDTTTLPAPASAQQRAERIYFAECTSTATPAAGSLDTRADPAESETLTEKGVAHEVKKSEALRARNFRKG